MKKANTIIYLMFACTLMGLFGCKKPEVKYPACGESFDLDNKDYAHLGFKRTFSDGSTSKIYKICEDEMYLKLVASKYYNFFLMVPEKSFNTETYLMTTYDTFDDSLSGKQAAFNIDSNYTIVTSMIGCSFFELYPHNTVFNSKARMTLEFDLYATNKCHYCTFNVKIDSLCIIRIDPNTMQVFEEMPLFNVQMQNNPSFPEKKGYTGIVVAEINRGGIYTIAARR